MFCKNCGKPVEEGWKVCPNCGASLEKKDVSSSSVEEDFGFTNYDQKTEQPNINRDPGYTYNNPYANGSMNQNGNASETQNASNESNGMAIAGFICAFFIPLLGIIFGAIGLSKSKQLNGSGRGLAIAAIILSIVTLIINFIVASTYFSQLIKEIESASINIF